MHTISLSNARKHMAELVDPTEKIVLTHNGKPIAVVLGINEYNSNQAMLELARDPYRYLRTMKAHLAVQKGELKETLSLDELEAQLMQNQTDS